MDLLLPVTEIVIRHSLMTDTKTTGHSQGRHGTYMHAHIYNFLQSFLRMFLYIFLFAFNKNRKPDVNDFVQINKDS